MPYQHETRRTAPDGTVLVSRSGGTALCACRRTLAPREGRASWWTLESIYAASVEIPIGDAAVEIAVRAEVPVRDDNYVVHRHGNRYWPTLIEVECATMTLHPATARELAQKLIDAADVADQIDQPDVDVCGHWAPCACRREV